MNFSQLFQLEMTLFGNKISAWAAYGKQNIWGFDKHLYRNNNLYLNILKTMKWYVHFMFYILHSMFGFFL